MPRRAPRLKPTAGGLKAATVQQLEVMMQAGIDAARRPGASMDNSNTRRRIAAGIRAKAKELKVAEPDLTDRVMKHLRAVARGHSDLLGDAAYSDEKLARAEMLERESDFAGTVAPELTEKEKRKYQRMESKLPPAVKPATAARHQRDPEKNGRRGMTPPPTSQPGRKAITAKSQPAEAERRVMEIVKRMGLGATRRQILDWAKENWTSGTSDRSIDEYIAAARSVLRSNWHRDREDFMVDLLEQYQRLASDARFAEQFGTSLGCLNSMAKLANMGGFANGNVQ